MMFSRRKIGLQKGTHFHQRCGSVCSPVRILAKQIIGKEVAKLKLSHKKALCLLLAGVMALSLLSGCGGKTAGGQPNTPDNSPVETGGNIPDNVPNNEAGLVKT